MDHENDRQAQEDEMEILTEILDADCFTKYVGSSISGKIKVKLRIPWGEFKCRFAATDGAQKAATSSEEVIAVDNDGPRSSKNTQDQNVEMISLKHLPPLNLHFTLPVDYPSNSKPMFTLSSDWLHRELLTFICGKLDELWEEHQGMAILFTWYSFLQEDAFVALGITSETVYDLMQVLPQNSTRLPLTTHSSGNEASSSSNNCSEDKKAEKVPKLEHLYDDLEKNNSRRNSCSSSSRPKVKGVGFGRHRRTKYRGAPQRLDSRAAFERVPGSLIQYLIEYEKDEEEAEFRRASHMCTICFSEKRGTDSMLFECAHIFCKECIQEFFNLHITEGSLDCVKCPDVTCKTVPTPHEVRAIVTPEMFERYDALLLTKTLDSMSDVLTCPRISCNRPVLYDPNEKLANCATCGYAFCSFCKMGYHGVEPCRFKSGETKVLCEKYRVASSVEKKHLEKTYGKRQLELLLQQTLSEEWVDSQSKKCPHCQVPIEKFEGCNKVTCFKCGTYFCWICGVQLDKGNPYFHYNNTASPCYNNLFQNVDVPGREDDDEDDSDLEDELWDSDEDDNIQELIQDFHRFLLNPRRA